MEGLEYDYMDDFYDWIFENLTHYSPSFNGQLEIGHSWVLAVLIALLALIGWECTDKLETISSETPLENIKKRIRLNHTSWRSWRRSLIVGIVGSTLLCSLYFYPLAVPPGFIWWFITLLIFGAVYLATQWTTSHWWKMTDYKIEDTLHQYSEKYG